MVWKSFCKSNLYTRVLKFDYHICITKNKFLFNLKKADEATFITPPFVLHRSQTFHCQLIEKEGVGRKRESIAADLDMQLRRIRSLPFLSLSLLQTSGNWVRNLGNMNCQD